MAVRLCVSLSVHVFVCLCDGGGFVFACLCVFASPLWAKMALCVCVSLCVCLTALGHDRGVFAQHGCGGLRQRDDHLQSKLSLHVVQVGVCAQLGVRRGRERVNWVNNEMILLRSCWPLKTWSR
jgi:hypothetical protein